MILIFSEITFIFHFLFFHFLLFLTSLLVCFSMPSPLYMYPLPSTMIIASLQHYTTMRPSLHLGVLVSFGRSIKYVPAT